MLLSRAAENLYWAARYLERAEDTARVVREHTSLMADLPRTVGVTWAPLLAITATDRVAGSADDERAIVAHLVADRDNPSSIVASVSRARDNLRSVREQLPRELWNAANDLYLFVHSDIADGVARATRHRFLDRVIAGRQRIDGVALGTMSRTEPSTFLRLGTDIERADMTTRVLDVGAATIIAQGERPAHAEAQWSSVLRSLAALVMFRRTVSDPQTGPSVVRFLLQDEAFPRSVRFCLDDVTAACHRLPRSDDLAAAARAGAALASLPVTDPLDPQELRVHLDRLQTGIAELHDRIATIYFP